MAENEYDMLERDVIASRHSNFYGNAFARKNSPEVNAADAEKAAKGLVPDCKEPDVEEPSSNLFDDLNLE